MSFKFFSHNGKLKPVEEAVIPLSNVEYSYGFGVYESIRVTNSVVYFLKDHTERLMESAAVIGLTHLFTAAFVEDAVMKLKEKTGVESYNLKILLIGGRTPENASLYILCLNPLFPDKKLYREGVSLVTHEYERMWPHAKTLNMLGSYLAYRKAKEVGAYDALLINKKGAITEGTRTNFFCIQGKTLVGAKEEDILLGVTKKAVLQVASENGFGVIEKDIWLSDLGDYDGAFITSTSSKIIPVRSIDSLTLPIPQQLRELMKLFDEFLENSGGILE